MRIKEKTINKSKYQFSQFGNDYHLKQYACELCGKVHGFHDMSTCDRCSRFICDNCSEVVANRGNNPYKFDFLCQQCIKELEND